MLGCCGLLLQGPPHKCALFFVDNSGVDIILGVMPFVRELLSRGTEVRNHGGGAGRPAHHWSGSSTMFPPTGGAGEQLRSSFERRNKRRAADPHGENRSHGSCDQVSLQPSAMRRRSRAAMRCSRHFMQTFGCCSLSLQERPDGGQVDVGPKRFQFSVSGSEVVLQSFIPVFIPECFCG